MEKQRTKKRILIFVPEFPRLSETFIERDISTLVELGELDVTVFSLTRASGALSSNLQGHVFYGRITLTDCLYAILRYIVLSPAKAFRTFMRFTGRDSVPFIIPTQGLVNTRFVHFLKGTAYATLISKFKPHELHVHFFSDASNIALAMAGHLNIPVSITAHARDVLEYPSLGMQKAKHAKFISVCNKNAFNALQKLTKSSEKIHLIYHGLDKEKLFSYPQSLSKPNVPVIFPGGTRLVTKKGLNYLLEASVILKGRNIPHLIYIVGPNKDSENTYMEYQQYVKEHDIDDHVKFLGDGKGVDFSYVSQIYRLTDVFVAPFITTSAGDADGIPNTLIEAALARIPIVCTDAGSLLEFIDSSCGLIIKQKDPRAIANAIEVLLKDQAKAVSLAENAHKKALIMFDAKKNVTKLQNLLKV